MTKTYHSFKSFSIVVLFTVCLIISGCEKTEPDPCDDTVKSEKAVKLQITVHILNLNDVPIPDEAINFRIYKTPCGAEPKGHFEYNGVTNAQGSWTSPVIGYNLRNSEDDVYLIAVATELENYFEQNFSSKRFKYNEFSISQKEVHLYIYSQDQE